ncbi:UNVERIFIED_CONTAM: hypothetical protein GTU68_035348, partial [Idotea baltica]|nr:hypothetical protein [Idotea baltica]
KKIKFPSAQTILLIIAGLVAILTWLIPSGNFDSLTYNKDKNTFTASSLGNSKTYPATQETLDKLNIKIPVDKFTKGDIWKPISIPNTYNIVESKPQGVLEFIKSPIKGIIESADIIFLVLFIGGLIGIINYTGAFDAGISWLAKTLKGYEFVLIIIVTIAIAIGGTTFGLAEETIAFYPILIPVFIAAKYDAMVALACIYLGSSVGTMCSTTNPFSAIIASDAAGINWTTGLTGRFIMLLLGTAICIIYIIIYAQRVKKDATKSIIFDQKEAIEKRFGASTGTSIKLTSRLRLILTVFVLCFVIMIYGVSNLDWWFIEMTTVFFVGAVLIGFIAKIEEYKFVDIFVKGAS